MNRTSLKMLLAAGGLAFLLALTLVPKLSAGNQKDSDILMQVLGGSADLAADAAYQEADLYFHAGVTGGCPHEHEKEGECKDEPETVSMTADLPLMGTIQYLNGQTSPKQHRHLQGSEEKELLPWFIATVRLNPHHIDAWRVGTYWYLRTGSKQRALDFVSQGITSNPDDYRLYMERGIVEHHLAKWKSTVSDMEHAQRLWKNLSDDSKYDAREIDIYLKDARSRL